MRKHHKEETNSEKVQELLDSISKMTNEELLAEHETARRNLYGKIPVYHLTYPMNFVYFSLICDELAGRGYRDLEGIDTDEELDQENMSPNDKFYDRFWHLAREENNGSPEQVVAKFCQALIDGDYQGASEYCKPEDAGDLIEDIYGGPGKITGIDGNEEFPLSCDYGETGDSELCSITIMALWDYGEGGEPERLEFKLARIDGTWKIVK